MMGNVATANNILVRKVYGKRECNVFCNGKEDVTEVHSSKVTYEVVKRIQPDRNFVHCLDPVNMVKKHLVLQK